MFISLRLPLIAVFPALALTAVGQTLEDGLDVTGLLEPLTTDSVLFSDESELPSGFWQYHTAESHDGIDSVKSSLPYRSDSRLRTTVQGPATVSFWWKINATNSFDRLYFYSRSDLTAISGNQDWQQRIFELEPGEQPLQWYFERLSSETPGGIAIGQAWIDQLVVTPIPNNPALQVAVDNNLYTLHSTDWVTENVAEAVNGSLAVSGPVEMGERSRMVLEVEGPAVVSFDWAMESDGLGGSEFSFYVNGSKYGSISGNQGLNNIAFDLGPGHHALKFEYSRDYYSDENYTGDYRGRLDNLQITAFGPSPTLADAVERPDGVYSNSWTRQTAVHVDGSDAAMVTAPEINKYRRLYVKLPDEPGLLTFWSKTETDPEKGTLYGVVDGDLALERSGTGDWQKTEVNLGQGSNRILQLIFFRTADVDANSPNGRVFVDSITFQPGADNFQPDLAIAQRGKPLRGIGRVNRNGVGQTAVVRSSLARPYGLYSIRCSHLSSTDRDKLSLRGIGSIRDFEIFFVVKEGKKKLNYSAAFRTGRFTTLNLDPGKRETHEIWIVKKQRGKARGHALTVVAKSETSPTKIDVVKTRLILKR